MNVASYNLDTRRDTIAVLVDLNGQEEMIPLIVFDPPDDMRGAAQISLVDVRPDASDAQIGWRQGMALVREVTAEPGKGVELAVARTWLAERVALLRASAPPGSPAIIEISFATVIDLPRGPRASARRTALITVIAHASRPSARSEARPVDLDALSPSGADRVAAFHIDIPADIVFEANRALSIDASCAGLPPESLDLEVAPEFSQTVTLRRGQSNAVAATRFHVTLDAAEELAGRTLSFHLLLRREALIGIVDRLLEDGRGQPPALLVTARMSGWGDHGASTSSDGADRRWLMPIPAVTAPVVSGKAADAVIAVGESSFSVDLDAPSDLLVGTPLTLELDPDAQGEATRFSGIKVNILRWPLARHGAISIAAVAHIGEESVTEPSAVVRLSLDRETSATRKAQTLLPLRSFISRLTQLMRSGMLSLSSPDIAVEVTMRADDAIILVARLPVRLARSMHRMPICIDLGASAISIWAGPPRSHGQSFDMKPLPIGSWLSSNVDPGHLELSGIDGGVSVLIPSHVSVDPLNHLRSDHAPHTLHNELLIGSDREASRLRMKHYQRRYDVSVPAPPPVGGGRALSRRILGLKHALATGQLAIAVNEPVHRYDPQTEKLTPTSVLDVGPLAADVLDELIDLYVMRLAQDDVRADMTDPAPVVPRIVVTCPSGIGAEVQERYDTALGIFAKRLDRLFPGASTVPDSVRALPESVAAARYVAELLAAQIGSTSAQPVILLTIDLGASTSDVALARLDVKAGRIAGFETLTSFGLPVGGGAIDAALGDIACLHVERLLSANAALVEPLFDGSSLKHALASSEPQAIAVQQWFSASIHAAKSGLAAAIAAGDAAAAYAWGEDETAPTFDLLLAERLEGGRWQGLCRWLGDGDANAQITVGPGVRCIHEATAAGAAKLLLRLDRQAVTHGSHSAFSRLAEVTHALGTLLQRMARAAVPRMASRPRVMIVPTGRAALWPPLFEALAAEAAHGRDEMPFARPLPVIVMKKAVVAGAALLTSRADEGGERPRHGCPFGLAVVGVHLAEQADGSLRTGAVAERVFYLTFDMAESDRVFALGDAAAPSLAQRADLGRRFHFVRAAPGLDPQGHMLAQLRPVLNHQDPMVTLDGDYGVDAQSERIDRFGACEIESVTMAAGSRRVTIRSGDSAWEGCWQIDDGRVVRIY